jgi:uncharacterized protein YrrD
MEIRTDAQVKTARDEVVGKVDRVVIDPRTLEVTHVVVQKGLLFTEDKVVPAEWIASTPENEVILKQDTVDVESLPDFEETHYLPVEEIDPQSGAMAVDYVARPYYWYPPVGVSPSGYPGPYMISAPRTETEQNIPEGTVALKEGAGVFDKNGDQVGNVERIYTDPSTLKATHFVLSSGLLFKERKLIPIHWVTIFEEDRVNLEVGAKFLERIPPFPEAI